MTPAALVWRVLAFILRARYELIPWPLDSARPGAPYLSRWHFPTWLARWYGARQLFLHHFHTGDPDRGWHNHPYEWCESDILDGAYVQECLWIDVSDFSLYPPLAGAPTRYRVASEVFMAGDRNYLTSHFHAIRLLTATAWTLFKAGPKHGESWGFKDLDGNFTPANPARGAMH